MATGLVELGIDTVDWRSGKSAARRASYVRLRDAVMQALFDDRSLFIEHGTAEALRSALDRHLKPRFFGAYNAGVRSESKARERLEREVGEAEEKAQRAQPFISRQSRVLSIALERLRERTDPSDWSSDPKLIGLEYELSKLYATPR